MDGNAGKCDKYINNIEKCMGILPMFTTNDTHVLQKHTNEMMQQNQNQSHEALYK